jgi:WD40 repeat protein/serine/threonine protein kinase
MARLKAKLFGPFEVSLNGGPATGFDSDKVRALLAYLVVEADRPHRREKLAGLLWPDFPERSARTNLRRALSNLRKVIGDRDADPPILFISRQTVQFNLQSESSIDVTTFLELITRQTHAAERLGEAVSLYRGNFLEGFSLPDSAAFEEWQRLNRESLQQQALRAMRRAASLYEGDSQYEVAIKFARRQVELEPYQEEAHQQLMRLLALSGRRSDALAQFETLKQVLAEELDVEPSAASVALYERIRTGDLERAATGVGRQTVRGYELRELIGRGHFGAVYRAYQPVIGRDVAIKVILPGYADDPGFIRRFEVEAQLVARLEHPAIVPLYDYWREPGGAFLVMRWLRTGSLQASLERGPWSTAPAIRLVDQVAAALNVAHRQGVVHRDIKPANILLDEESNAYLSDFGVASLVGPLGTLGESLPALTAGDTWGSLGYQSPETIHHEQATPMTDIYSFGVVIYELLGAQHPFPDIQGQELLNMHLNEPLPSIRALRPELPPAVDEVIQRATAKDPGERFADALALAAAFHQAVEGETITIPVPGDEVEIHNPYKGLRAFQTADAADFFGRETLSKRLLGQIENNRFLSVVGPSGSGKSSDVKAGLIPALRQGALPGSGEWFIAEITPGSQPMEELETALLRIAVNPPESLLSQMQDDPRGLLRAIRRALPDDESQLFLVIDQFEELFTLVEDEEKRNHFLNSLLVAAKEQNGPLRLVITLRADYYDRPLQYAGFGELMRQHTEVVLPLSPDEMERAIAGPAERVGLFVEPGLVTEIVADVMDQPGTLPLLQYALTELFEQRDNNHLSLKTYHAIGGVTGAMARRAEELYAGLDGAGQEVTRQLFLQLLTLGEEGEANRRHVLRSELMSLENSLSATGDAQLSDIIDTFGSARLLTFDRDATSRAPTVEVAHEALLHEWDRLRGWLEAGRSDLIMYRQLIRANSEWIEAGRDESFLLRGERLIQFESWAGESQLALSVNEQVYLQASNTRREERAAAERQRQEQEAHLEGRATWRLKALLVVGAVALVVVIGLVIAAVSYAQEQRLVEERERLILALELTSAALANLETDPELSVLLALEAAENSYVSDGYLIPDLEDLLHRAVQADGVELTIGMGGAVAFSPDGQILAVGNEESLIRTWDPVTGKDVWGVLRYQGNNQKIGDIAFSPDGRFLATSSLVSLVKIWDAKSSLEIGVIKSQEGVTGVVFSPDSRQLMTAGVDGAVRLWDLGPVTGGTSKGAQPVELVESTLFRQESSEVSDVIYSSDGQRVAVLVPGKSIVVLDAGSGEQLLEITGVGGLSTEIAFNPEGSRLAGSSGDLEATIWDAGTGEKVLTVNDSSTITDIDFTPDNRFLATATIDGTVSLWDMVTGRRSHRLAGHASWIEHISFNPVTGKLATSGVDGLTRIWDLNQAASELFSIAAHQGEVYDAVFNADGSKIASAGEDGLVKLWDGETGELLHALPGPLEWPHYPAFSPDGRRLAAVGRDGGIIIWDANSGQKLLGLDEDITNLNAISFSLDGSRLAAGGQGSLIHIWDADTGERLSDISTDRGSILELFFTPDGSSIRTLAQGGLVTTWDVVSGVFLGSIPVACPLDSQIDAEVTADGQITVVACDRIALLRTDDTLENEGVHYTLEDDIIGASGVAINPDGTILAASSSTGVIKLLDLETEEERFTLAGQELLTKGEELRADTRGGLPFYHQAFGYLYPTRASFARALTGIDFSSDGRFLVAAGSDGTVSVYIISIEELMEAGRSRLSRGFSKDECRKYLSLDSCPEES